MAHRLREDMDVVILEFPCQTFDRHGVDELEVQDPRHQGRSRDAVPEQALRTVAADKLPGVAPYIDAHMVLDHFKCGRMEVQAAVYLIRQS